MSMSGSSGGDDGPMMDINTTPLIDVMLVLLIMFIITLPPPTDAVKIDLPPPCEPNCPPPPDIKPDKNLLQILPNDQLLWNGQPLLFSQLQPLLNETQKPPEGKAIPELHLQPDAGARYNIVDHVLAATKRAKISKMGFIGNDAYFSAF